jgi:hypothetical protein
MSTILHTACPVRGTFTPDKISGIDTGSQVLLCCPNCGRMLRPGKGYPERIYLPAHDRKDGRSIPWKQAVAEARAKGVMK